MKTDELRKQTCIIIQKDGEYLVGTVLYSLDLRWSYSAFDAWRTRDREAARRIAEIVDGEMILFNPIIGKTREIVNHEIMA